MNLERRCARCGEEIAEARLLHPRELLAVPLDQCRSHLLACSASTLVSRPGDESGAIGTSAFSTRGNELAQLLPARVEPGTEEHQAFVVHGSILLEWRMELPFDYPYSVIHEFGGARPVTPTFGDARVVVVPVPLDRTTSYVPGTRNGPREILLASSHLELWDEEVSVDVHGVGIFTLPEMEFPHASMEETLAQIQRVAAEVVSRHKFPVVLGGEHSITVPVVAALAQHHPELTLLQIDAHADLRESYMGSPHNHACAVRGSLRHARRATQVGIRSLSTEEAAAVDELPVHIFYDWNMRQHSHWIDRVVETLGENVYITIDCDALDPAIMPAVGTPEPGGLNWAEMLALLRAVSAKRHVVGFDLVELSPIPGMVAPNFLSAKLVYKLLSYLCAGTIGTSAAT